MQVEAKRTDLAFLDNPKKSLELTSGVLQLKCQFLIAAFYPVDFVGMGSFYLPLLGLQQSILFSSFDPLFIQQPLEVPNLLLGALQLARQLLISSHGLNQS